MKSLIRCWLGIDTDTVKQIQFYIFETNKKLASIKWQMQQMDKDVEAIMNQQMNLRESALLLAEAVSNIEKIQGETNVQESRTNAEAV